MRSNPVVRLSILILTLPLIFACIPLQKATQKPSTGLYYSSLTRDDYSNEIGRMKALAENGADKVTRTDAHLYLALLYSSHVNPKRDFKKAIEELEKYMSLKPGGSDDYEVQNLSAHLNEIERLSKEVEEIKGQAGDVKGLKKENKKLRAGSRALAEENKKLIETIEKLKILDMEMEKKRKSFR